MDFYKNVSDQLLLIKEESDNFNGVDIACSIFKDEKRIYVFGEENTEILFYFRWDNEKKFLSNITMENLLKNTVISSQW